MNDSGQLDKNSLLHPHQYYQDGFIPEHVIFNTQLQEFARRVESICGLQTGGLMSSDLAYQQIYQLYQQLRKSREVLGVSSST
ncbi:MAG: hypothetical protein Kow00121_53930 [Elainellaceae cyanobacterium]